MSNSTQCRAAVAGGCDVAEYCPGNGASCPTDVVMPSSTVCHPTQGFCDPAENCTGSSPSCPADLKAPNTTVCRSSAGGCDFAENCDGASNTCPADVVRGAGYVCRNASNVCDVAETCDGINGTCPVNGYAPASTVCGLQMTYTGPTPRNSSTCGGVASCTAPSTKVCAAENDQCSGTAATCTQCICICQ